MINNKCKMSNRTNSFSKIINNRDKLLNNKVNYRKTFSMDNSKFNKKMQASILVNLDRSLMLDQDLKEDKIVD